MIIFDEWFHDPEYAAKVSINPSHVTYVSQILKEGSDQGHSLVQFSSGRGVYVKGTFEQVLNKLTFYT